MRLSHSVLLASAAAATPLSEWASLCVRSQAGQIESLVACSDASSLTDCLNELSERFPPADLEACLAASGCTKEMAAAGAETLVHACEALDVGSGDLRKRQRGGTKDEEDTASDSTDSTDSKSDKEDTKSPPKEEPADEKDEPAEPAKETPKPAAKTQEAKAEAETTATPEAATTSSKAARPTDSECYDTSTETTTSCGGTKDTCEPIPIEKKFCRAGYVCVIEDKGGVSCMEAAPIPTEGIIIAIVFASALVLALGMMTFFCCKDRREQKNLAAKAEAAAIAKASNVGKKARNVSDRQPLMAGPGPSSPGGAPYGGEQPNPFNDQSRY